MKKTLLYGGAVMAATLFGSVSFSAETPKWPQNIQVVLDNTKPLAFSHGKRLPLYLWPAMDPGVLSDADAEALVKELDGRGVGLICSWSPKNKDKSLERALSIARAQKKLGAKVNVHASSCMNSFFNGDEKTAHIDNDGKHFWDDSFGKVKMGCPFALDFRKNSIKEQFIPFINAYKDAGLDIGFIFTDWEIDGPIEFNKAWEFSKKCARCRENVKNINDFAEFQKNLRIIRSELQHDCYAKPILDAFPQALVGNYAVYPNDGYRYWYDYFEYYVDGQPCKTDQKAKYRKWYQDFPLTGFTFAMPVFYTWCWTYDWYDFANNDYRWFYNMLLNASNAGKSTPADIPIISFVHWHTTAAPEKSDTKVTQMSEWAYQEFLWHALLRGTDTFFLWCPKNENAKEVSLVAPVYAAAQEYGDFLENGTPINFEVPAKPGTVISGLKSGNNVLVRRTDFDGSQKPVEITVGNMKIIVPALPGKCQILKIN